MNPRHADFQSAALPTELSDHTRVIKRRASFYRLIPFRSRGQVLFYEISPCNTHGTPNNERCLLQCLWVFSPLETTDIKHPK